MQNYGAPKSRESQPWRFRDSHLGVPGQKVIWMWAPWRGAEYTIRGKVVASPQVRAVVSLVCLCCSWVVLAPKVLQLCTNHLVRVVCRPMWVNEACQLFLVSSRSSSTPFYPSKCCELGNVPRLLLPLSSTWTHIWVFQGVGSASLKERSKSKF
jgi:hypothetical protein